MKTSVLIPSWRRPAKLEACLLSLDRQTRKPDEVFVVWQADDHDTREMAESLVRKVNYKLIVLHSETAGVVPAENLALAAASGEIILLIDDDAIAPPGWLERHTAFYSDPTVGGVGGPAVNFNPDGSTFPKRAVGPIGKLTWFGKLYGNMYDHVPEWASRSPIEVTHLVGYNMSLRRGAFDKFEINLRRYWKEFELEACLQVRAKGFRILFDFANAVDHHPTNTAYTGGRDGDLVTKVYNAAYNSAYILSRHSPWHLRLPRFLFPLFVGSTNVPGVLGSLVAWRRYGNLRRELGVLRRTIAASIAGWFAGRCTLPSAMPPGRG